MSMTTADIPPEALDGEWHHVAIIRRDGETKIFFDGKLTKQEE